MVAVPSRRNDDENQSNFAGAEEALAPIRVPANKLPPPGRKMGFREALEASLRENHELYERLD